MREATGVKLAHDGYAGEVVDPSAAERLRDEHKKLIDGATDPVNKIRELLKEARNGQAVGFVNPIADIHPRIKKGTL